jgi:DNA-binding CsgD family transcriptional regulator
MAYCWFYNLTRKSAEIPSHIENIRNIWKTSSFAGTHQQPSYQAVIPSLGETMEAIVALEVDKNARNGKNHAKRAIELIPADITPTSRGLLYGAAAFRLAQSYYELEEYEQAIPILLEILELFKNIKNYIGAANTVYLLLMIYQETNQISMAMELCEDTLTYIKQHQWDKLPPAGMIYILCAETKSDAGKIDEANSHFEFGRRLVEPMTSPQITDLVDRVRNKLDASGSDSQPLIEPLSERELEVLGLIAQGLSNREIGEQLYLALDTIKGHNRRIFEKLGVRKRIEAVTQAKELRLL